MTSNKLKDLRIKNKYTQDKMVELLGLKHKSHYCQIENGIIKPSLELANKIAKIFDDSIENIFFNENVHESETLRSNIHAS